MADGNANKPERSRRPGKAGRTISRRSALKAAGAVAAAPYVLGWPMRALAASKALPSNRVAVGIVGCGRAGYNWAENYYRMRQFQFVRVCDVDDERTQRLAARIARRDTAPKTGRDFREVLADDDIDAVVIATPDHWHAVIACAAARAGKDIYCESPLALTVREAKQMADLARRYGRIFQVGLSHRYYSAHRRAAALVRGGALGKVSRVYASCGSASDYCLLGAAGKCPETFDWDLWLGPAPWAPYNAHRCSYSYDGWRSHREYSGGPLAYNGAGQIEILQWALGLDDTAPVEYVPPKRRGEDTIPLTMRYADGTEVRNERGPHKGTIEFVGDQGSLALGVGNQGFTTWPNNLAGATVGDIGPARKFSSDTAADFGHCVRTRTPPLADAHTARWAASAANLACIAWWTNRTIKYDPAGGKILGDPYAARLLDRPKRMPWRC